MKDRASCLCSLHSWKTVCCLKASPKIHQLCGGISPGTVPYPYGRRAAMRQGLRKIKLGMRRIRMGKFSTMCIAIWPSRFYSTCCRISSCVSTPQHLHPDLQDTAGTSCSGDEWGKDNLCFCLLCTCGCIYLSACKRIVSSCIAWRIGFQQAASRSGWLQQVEQLWEGDGSVQGILHQSVSDVHPGPAQCPFAASFLHDWCHPTRYPSWEWHQRPVATPQSTGHGLQSQRWHVSSHLRACLSCLCCHVCCWRQLAHVSSELDLEVDTFSTPSSC